jgi:hypothetical protein
VCRWDPEANGGIVLETFRVASAAISGQESHDGWVGNLEGSVALAYAPYGPRGWDVSLGIRAED